MAATTATKTCASCGANSWGLVRRLCSPCYDRHKKDGTLDQYDRLAPPGEGVPTIEGISYRQLDFWIRQGYLHPTHGFSSGVPRHWPDGEVAVARLMARLVKAGLPPAVAHRVARGETEIGPGVRVVVSAACSHGDDYRGPDGTCEARGCPE